MQFLFVVAVLGIVCVMGFVKHRENRARHDAQIREWQAANAAGQWQPLPARPPTSGWTTAARVLAAVVAVVGLLWVALFLLIASLGSVKLGNK
jgi:hypothetical protein